LLRREGALLQNLFYGNGVIEKAELACCRVKEVGNLATG
jgi:hypothetical protein